MNIEHLTVSGKGWQDRFSSYAKHAILTKRGFKMQGSFTKEYSSMGELQKDLRPGDQIISLPIVLHCKGRN